MASPQKENGYTPVANEILEEIAKIKLNATQLRILLILWRYTYGFSRKEHELSETFISKAIESDRIYIHKQLERLIKMNIVLVEREPTFSKARVIAFNKNYEQWCQIRPQVSNQTTGIQLDNTTGVFLDNTTGVQSDTQDKQSLKQKENKRKKTPSPEMIAEAERLYQLYPRKKGKADALKKLPKLIEKYGSETIERAISKYADEMRGKDPQYIQYASRFFNNGYLDYIEDEEPEQPKFTELVEVEVYDA